jgi:hypothetical protein
MRTKYMLAYLRKARGFFRADVYREELQMLSDLQSNKGGEISCSLGE